MQVWTAAVLLACTAALWVPTSRDRSRVRASFGFLMLWVLALAADTYFGISAARDVAFALLALSAIQVAAVVLFDLLLRRAAIPKFASEMLIVAGYVSVLFNLLYREGVNVTGIFATSAVATAVIGLALQDMLSNIAGGIALELEGGIRPGDYVKCADHSGWVKHVRLRHTAIVTPDNDIVILPNSQLTRSPVHVSSREHRHFIPFHMSYGVNSQEVIDAVEAALRSSPIPGVLAEPAPCCIVQAMEAGHVRYAVMLWTDQAGREVGINSAVMTRLLFALGRAGMPATSISHVLEMRSDTSHSLTADPIEVLRRTPILRLLHDGDLLELAGHLRSLSFAPGEFIIRQGAEGSSMYFIVNGEVTIVFTGADGTERIVASMSAGDFFGEASLLTGETRSASAIARTKVDCYCLDKDALHRLMSHRVELAEDMSVVMTHRQTELMAAREQLDIETAMRRQSESQTQLLARIRNFFGITANGAKA